MSSREIVVKVGPREAMGQVLVESRGVSGSVQVGGRVVQVVATAAVGRRGSQGLQGVPGAPGAGAFYSHVQGVASSTWVIPHNLGVVLAGWVVLNQDDEEVVGDITELTTMSTTIEFAFPLSGRAYGS